MLIFVLISCVGLDVLWDFEKFKNMFKFGLNLLNLVFFFLLKFVLKLSLMTLTRRNSLERRG